MDDAEKLQFVAILLRDAAGDFLDTLEFPEDYKDPWDFFKTAFLARFGRLETTTWRKVQQRFATPQAAEKAASDFIARMTRAAKRVDVDDKLLEWRSCLRSSQSSEHTSFSPNIQRWRT